MSGIVADDKAAELIGAAAESARPSEREGMPLPHDPRTVFLGGIFLLASLAALYAASDIILPIVLAVVLKLLLQPLVRFCERIYLPRVLGAVIVVALVIGALVGIGMLLTGPASAWAGRLPEAIPRVQQKLRFLNEPGSCWDPG